MNSDNRQFSLGKDVVLPVLLFLFWVWAIITVIRAAIDFICWLNALRIEYKAYRELGKQLRKQAERETILNLGQPPTPNNTVKYGLSYGTALNQRTFTWEPEVLEEDRNEDLRKLGPNPSVAAIIEINSRYQRARDVNRMYKFVYDSDQKYLKDKMETGQKPRHIKIHELL